MKSRSLICTVRVFGIALVLCCIAQLAIAETIVRTLRDGRPVEGVQVLVIKTASGREIESLRSGPDGIIRIEGLEEGVLYQVQTLDGDAYSESFTPGTTLDFETGRGGWNLAGRIGFAIGSSSAQFESDLGLDVDESGVGGGPEFEVLLFAPPKKILLYGVRPFVMTGLQISAIKPDGFKDSDEGNANIEDTVRWRLGGGLAVPVELASYTFSVEPSLHYALTASKFKSRPAGASEESKSFTSHAIQLGIAAAFPIGKLGPAAMSFDVGLAAHIPVAGSATLGSVLDAEPTVDVQGGFGIRGTFTGLFAPR